PPPAPWRRPPPPRTGGSSVHRSPSPGNRVSAGNRRREKGRGGRREKGTLIIFPSLPPFYFLYIISRRVQKSSRVKKGPGKTGRFLFFVFSFLTCLPGVTG